MINILKSANETSTDSTGTDSNDLMNIALVDLLFEKFLPYSFIWSGFVYNGVENVTRFTNGCVESTIGNRKKVVIQKCNPALYINNTSKLAIGQERISELLNSKRKNDSNDSNDSLSGKNYF